MAKMRLKDGNMNPIMEDELGSSFPSSPLGGGEDGIHRQVIGPGGGSMEGGHNLPDYMPGMASETGRDRAQLRMGGMGKGSPTPSRPSTPTPMAGSVQGGGGGVIPFEPLEDTLNEGMDLSPIGGEPAKLRGLLGSAGGLQGGGLGVPFDPVADEKSDPIALLMELLSQSQNGGRGGYV